jgi:hypothetical protein
VEALRALNVPVVISTRPVIEGDRLTNEAFVLERGHFRFLHQKHFFFRRKRTGYGTLQVFK